MRPLTALVLALVLVGGGCVRFDKVVQQGAYGLRKTGTTVPVNIEIEDSLVQTGRFRCNETEIIGEGPEAGKFTPEIRGGTIRRKDSARFNAVIEYVIEAGGESFTGTQRITTEALTVVNLKAPEFENSLSNPNPTLHIPKGLSACKLKISEG
ncbi:MAG: hypothetical protein ABIS18_11215 [Actinomycetota bacterium]